MSFEIDFSFFFQVLQNTTTTFLIVGSSAYLSVYYNLVIFYFQGYVGSGHENELELFCVFSAMFN